MERGVITGAAELSGSLSGSVVLPDDPQFQSLRKTFVGGLVDQLPQAVVRCASPADVAAAVAFARKRGLPFAVRSGGHSFADLSSTDGLLIDLGEMNSIQLDGELVTVGPGTQLGVLANRLVGHRRTTTCTWNPRAAMGAVLGGGYGMVSRYLGLGCDQLVAAQVVLADGGTVWADETREPELFWALRGAGWAGLGVVTALVLRTSPVPPVTRFVHRFRWSQAAEAIDAWQRWAPAAPDHVNAELALHNADSFGEPRATLFGTVIGGAVDARPALAELWERSGLDGEVDELTELSAWASATRYTFAGIPQAEGALPLPPRARPWLHRVRTEFFDQLLPAEAIEALVEAFTTDEAPAQFREVELVPWGGAYARLAPNETAFVHRRSLFQIGHHGMVGFDAGDEQRAAIMGWVDRSWAAVHPWGSGRVYPNFPDRELPGGVEPYFGDNLPRLRRIKAAYDPEDVFRSALSVPPAPTPAITGTGVDAG